jgi:hypothetical protein
VHQITGRFNATMFPLGVRRLHSHDGHILPRMSLCLHKKLDKRVSDHVCLFQAVFTCLGRRGLCGGAATGILFPAFGHPKLQTLSTPQRPLKFGESPSMSFWCCPSPVLCGPTTTGKDFQLQPSRFSALELSTPPPWHTSITFHLQLRLHTKWREPRLQVQILMVRGGGVVWTRVCFPE